MAERGVAEEFKQLQDAAEFHFNDVEEMPIDIQKYRAFSQDHSSYANSNFQILAFEVRLVFKV